MIIKSWFLGYASRHSLAHLSSRTSSNVASFGRKPNNALVASTWSLYGLDSLETIFSVLRDKYFLGRRQLQILLQVLLQLSSRYNHVHHLQIATSLYTQKYNVKPVSRTFQFRLCPYSHFDKSCEY